ncbi:LacI family DNA-binding transcriptional regulator [Alteribacter populi]|uniref:LacI family DNA-binding transcriptional regulator n=1 Tax=Alteribacter populi TaxID=2011011 RepID=UPI000BBAC67A|nr:LacI family DNA-binding transcriptional regulator [Alteribacter populi]
MVSSKDVAKHAGVSQSTVSRVLNDPSKVNAENVRKVQDAMKVLHYRPNSVARSLVSNQTKTIALISGPLHNPFFVETTTSIVNYAEARGYRTMVFFEHTDENKPIYDAVLSARVDGILLSSIFREDPIFEELKGLNIPIVMYNRKHNDGGNYVEINNEMSGALAASHLLDLGHTSLGLLSGPNHTSTFHGRKLGFTAEFEKRTGEKFPPEMIIETNTTEAAIHQAVLDLMSRKHRPTAIFAATDSIAFFAVDKLQEAGYIIPDDISICGMDNVSLASHRSFQLTSIGHKGPKNLGLLGVEHLIDMIERQTEEDVQITLEPTLFERNTTKPK